MKREQQTIFNFEWKSNSKSKDFLILVFDNGQRPLPTGIILYQKWHKLNNINFVKIIFTVARGLYWIFLLDSNSILNFSSEPWKGRSVNSKRVKSIRPRNRFCYNDIVVSCGCVVNVFFSCFFFKVPWQYLPMTPPDWKSKLYKMYVVKFISFTI